MKKTWRNTAISLGLSAVLGLAAVPMQADESTDQKSFTVGILQQLEFKALDDAREGFLEGLAEAGFEEGKNLVVDYKNAQNDSSNAQTIAQVFKEKKYDLHLSIGTSASQALVHAVKDRPILFTAVTDPVDAKLVPETEHPGGFVSGSSDRIDLKAQLSVLKEVCPDVKTLAIVYSSGERNSALQAEWAREAAKELDLEASDVTIASSSELTETLEHAMSKFDAIFIPTDNAISAAMPLVHKMELKHKKPVLVAAKTMLEDGGGLLCMGINYFDLGKKTGAMAAKILSGEKVGDLSVFEMEDFDFYFKSETLKALGFELPQEWAEKGHDVDQPSEAEAK
ncbi:MAG: ABC transporter substrate-binding protein [Eubacteriales bacterium]|nr:ABC transporter substrate-binding protein [Eubacteriales bacterium]